MARYLTWALTGSFGIAAFLIALDFGFGGGPRIGSAPFPLIMSGGIVLVSLWGLVGGPAAEGDDSSALELRPLAAVAAAVVLFIVTIEWLGLVPAVVASMLAAYLGQTRAGYPAFLLYAVLFGLGVWLLFSEGLGLPVAPFGSR